MDWHHLGKAAATCIVLTMTGLLSLNSPSTTGAADLLPLGPKTVITEFQQQDGVQYLPKSRWLVQSQGDRRGTAMHWTAGPFVHTRDPRFVVDSRLQIVGTGQRRNSAVSVIVSQDETHVTQGDRSASVSAAVIRPGVDGIELQVGFLARDASTIAAGEYVTRIVGTVTGY